LPIDLAMNFGSLLFQQADSEDDFGRAPITGSHAVRSAKHLSSLDHRMQQLPPKHASQEVAFLADGEDALEEDDADQELILSSCHGNIQAAAFVLTVRGLRDRRYAGMLMAWLWVLLSITINVFLLQVAYSYLAFKMGHYEFDDGNPLEQAAFRLIEAVSKNTTLGDRAGDAKVIKLCHTLPSPYFFAFVEFIFNAYLMSQLGDCRTLLCQIFTCPTVQSRGLTTEDSDDGMIVLGLMSGDAFWLIIGLVCSKVAVTLALWQVGTALLAFSQEMLHMSSRAFLLLLISQVDHVLFQAFMSSSKKDWVRRCQVVQLRGSCVRYSTAWPGEVTKLLTVLLGVGLAYAQFWQQFDTNRLLEVCDCMRQLVLQSVHAVQPWWAAFLAMAA